MRGGSNPLRSISAVILQERHCVGFFRACHGPDFVEQSRALSPVLRRGSAQGAEATDELTELVDEPDAEKTGKSHGERDEHAKTKCGHFETEHHLERRVCDHRRNHTESVLQKRDECREAGRQDENGATSQRDFTRARIRERFCHVQNGDTARPRKRFIFEDEAARERTHEHAEVGRDRNPNRHLPPRGVKPDVVTEDRLDVVERAENDAHESDTRDGGDHGLDDVELNGEILPLVATAENGRRKKHRAVGEIRAHAELQDDVRRRCRTQDATDEAKKVQSPVQFAKHGRSFCLSPSFASCWLPNSNKTSLFVNRSTVLKQFAILFAQSYLSITRGRYSFP